MQLGRRMLFQCNILASDLYNVHYTLTCTVVAWQQLGKGGLIHGFSLLTYSLEIIWAYLSREVIGKYISEVDRESD